MTVYFQMQVEGERVVLAGELTFASVSSALKQTKALLNQAGDWVFDLAEVERIDSAGLALLLEWRRRIEKLGGRIRFIHLPPQLQAIAKVVGVENFIFSE